MITHVLPTGLHTNCQRDYPWGQCKGGLAAGPVVQGSLNESGGIMGVGTEVPSRWRMAPHSSPPNPFSFLTASIPLPAEPRGPGDYTTYTCRWVFCLPHSHSSKMINIGLLILLSLNSNTSAPLIILVALWWQPFHSSTSVWHKAWQRMGPAQQLAGKRWT